MTDKDKKLPADAGASAEAAVVKPDNTTSLAGLPGISGNTRRTLSNLSSGGYTPSESVTTALSELKDVIANQPGEFQSDYYRQLGGAMNDILGRKAFTYDIANDPMYRLYREGHISAGKRAMEDTMGQAARMTGGYGSSYSATAGQQAYNRHLSELNDRIPELYRMARDAYDAEGASLMQKYNILNDVYQQEYGRYSDDYDRWADSRDKAFDRYATEQSHDRELFTEGRSHELGLAELDQQQTGLEMQQQQAEWERDQADRKQAADDREYFYNVAMDMLEMGRTPSAALLRSAGLTEEDIAMITGRGGSSSGSSSSGKNAKNKRNTSGKKDSGYSSKKSAASAAAVSSGSKLDTIRSLLDSRNGR